MPQALELLLLPESPFATSELPFEGWVSQIGTVSLPTAARPKVIITEDQLQILTPDGGHAYLDVARSGTVPDGTPDIAGDPIYEGGITVDMERRADWWQIQLFQFPVSPDYNRDGIVNSEDWFKFTEAFFASGS